MLGTCIEIRYPNQIQVVCLFETYFRTWYDRTQRPHCAGCSSRGQNKGFPLSKPTHFPNIALLFGKDETNLSVIPHHKTDLILRRENLDRFDDRDDVRTNLIESYDRIITFGQKYPSDPFYPTFPGFWDLSRVFCSWLTERLLLI